MAYSNNEDEFKLPLRQWLKNKIDQGAFEGLDWIDEEAQIFKIPWTQKGHPGWEEHYKIFTSWAKHRGRFDESEPPNHNRLKGNFRCVLHKSEDFVEIKEKNKTNQQTGNYKVFKILAASEVKAKTEQRKRTRSKSPSTTSSSTVPVVLHHKKRSKTTENQTCATYPLADTIATPCQTDDGLLNSLPVLEAANSVSLPRQIPLSHTEPVQGVSMQLPEIPLDDVNQFLVCGLDEIIESNIGTLNVSSDFHNMQTIVGSSTDAEPRISNEDNQLIYADPFEEFLEKSNLEKTQLSKFLLSVSYGNELIFFQHLLDLTTAHRILYGDALAQRKILEEHGKITDDFYLKAMQLPKYKGEDEKVRQYLKLSSQGFVLKVDCRGNLLAKRLSQSHIWLSKDLQHPVKLIRNEETEIFSYSKHVQEVLTNSNQPPTWKIELVIGEEPSKTHIHNVKFVIEPILGSFIESYFVNGNSSSSSLDYSSEASIDKVLRMFNKQSLDNEQ